MSRILVSPRVLVALAIGREPEHLSAGPGVSLDWLDTAGNFRRMLRREPWRLMKVRGMGRKTARQVADAVGLAEEFDAGTLRRRDGTSGNAPGREDRGVVTAAHRGEASPTSLH